MLESISGRKKYRVSPHNPCVVQVQHKYRGRWELYKACRSHDEAQRLVLELAKNVKGESEG